MLEQTLALARLTLRDPQRAARILMQNQLGRPVLIEAAVLVVTLEVLAAFIGQWINPVPQSGFAASMFSSPLLLTIMQIAVLYLTVLAVFLIGRIFGGTGLFDQTLQLMLWLQLLTLAVEVAEIPLFLILGNAQSLIGLITLATAIFATWLTVNFIAVLHGFSSLLKVFAGLMGTSIILAFLLMVFLVRFGLIEPGV